jgi:hypothetical protein
VSQGLRTGEPCGNGVSLVFLRAAEDEGVRVELRPEPLDKLAQDTGALLLPGELIENAFPRLTEAIDPRAEFSMRAGPEGGS